MDRRAQLLCAALALVLPAACDRPGEPTPTTKSSAAVSASTSSGVASKPPSAASSSIVAPSADLGRMMIGTWAFQRFDLDDKSTGAKWSMMEPDDKVDVLSKAPQARLIIAEKEITAKLAGVPDWKSSFTIEPDPLPGTIVIKTDDGRKRFSFVTPDLMRVEEIDNHNSMVTLFRRVTDASAAGSTSASGSASGAPATAPSGSTSAAPSASSSKKAP